MFSGRIVSLRTSFYKVQLESLWYGDKFEGAYILATETFYKIQARPVAVFTGRILTKVQLGLVCVTGRTLSVHTYLLQSHSIKYRQGQSQRLLGEL